VGTTWTTIQPFSSAYTFPDTGLTASTTYSYRVRYRNQYGTIAAFSPSKSATTQAPPPAAPTGSTSPRRPRPRLTWTWTAAATRHPLRGPRLQQNVKGSVTDPTVTLTESGLHRETSR
jgi:hypothetical protein